MLSSPSSVRDRLLHRIHRRFPTTTKRLQFGDLAIDFTRVADPDKVLDEVAAEEDRREKSTGLRFAEPLHLPYWAELWDSAEGIGHFLTQRPSLVAPAESPAAPSREPSVLDLGCGQGLAGTVAAALGCRVLFADLESPALLFAKYNTLPWADRTSVRRLNWQTDDLKKQFDLIIGSDILYERKQWEHLEPFWRKHLKTGGSVLLGEPGRPTGDVFPDWIRALGWGLEAFEQRVSSRPGPIRLFLIQAPGASHRR